MRSPPGSTFRVRTHHIKTYMTAAGLDNAQLAARMGVDKATVSRMLSGRRVVSSRTLGGLWAVFPTKTFGDLFELVDEEDEEDAGTESATNAADNETAAGVSDDESEPWGDDRVVPPSM